MVAQVRPAAEGARLIGVPTYRLHDTTGDDLGLVEHPAQNVEHATQLGSLDRTMEDLTL